MNTKNPKLMRKHEACYHLMRIRKERMQQRESFMQPVGTQKRGENGVMIDLTPDEIKLHQSWRDKNIQDCDLQIEALDIAGEALTG